ncbi:MAG: hypothetical protein EBV07_00150 [Proteobacteria bacterium]|nr:hypothetical protein [Pseudomonadota bacterium]
MKSKTLFSKKYLLIIVLVVILIIYLISRFSINFIDFEGDLVYLDLTTSRISGLLFLKNNNLLFSNKENFITELRNQNPEIKEINVYPKNFSHLSIKIKNNDICCVLIDSNTNKFLISSNGKVYKQLSRDQNYPNEISLNQSISLNSNFSIESLKKIVEIENILIDRKLDVLEIMIENDKIEFKLKDNQYVVIDSTTNTKNFMDKLFTMLDYLKQKNLSFKKMDFRFGNVVVE